MSGLFLCPKTSVQTLQTGTIHLTAHPPLFSSGIWQKTGSCAPNLPPMDYIHLRNFHLHNGGVTSHGLPNPEPSESTRPEKIARE